MISYSELLRFIWRFLRGQRWTFFAIFLVDSFAWPIDAMLWPYILNVAIGIFTSMDADRAAAWGALSGPILGGPGLVIYIEIASRTMGFLMAKAIPRLQADLRMEMFDHVQRHSPRYFQERFGGSLANKISDMTTQVESILQQLFWPLVPALSALILGTAFLWFVHPVFSWILLSWTIVHLLVCILFSRPCDALERRHGESRSALVGKIVDSFANYFAVNLFYRFSYEKQTITPYQNHERETNQTAKKYVEKMRSVLSLFYFAAVILGMFGSLLYLWVHHRVTTGQVVQVFTTMWSLTMVLWNVGSSLPILFQSIGLAKQAYTVMKDPQDLGDVPDARPLKIANGEIAFENVSFQYGERKLFENKQVKIRGGERVGLVGYTGAGKSTFINLILRFFPLRSGRILIDNQDIAYATLKSLRRQIALIPQEPVLFHRTLKENIAYGNPKAAEGEILRAAKIAHCDEFIRNFPMGYEAKVGERGTKLSGGEKQRIAIARAVLADTPILILDEATSSLDSVTERYIQDSLEKLMQNRTTLVIAHRLSTLSRMDRLLVFDQGRIVEDGTHASLLDKGGIYAQMWKMQAGGFLPEAPTH